MSTEKETSITEEYFRQRSQQLGWKFTNQRYSIYRCMVGNKNHPTADEVKKMLEKEYPNISRDSVFRILNDFVSVGLIGKLEFSSPLRCAPIPLKVSNIVNFGLFILIISLCKIN